MSSYDRLGSSVAISADGNYAVVGAPYFDHGDATDAGKAYVFQRSGSGWTLVDELLASDAARNDEFGNAVDINGDGTYIVVGAYADDNGTGGTNLNRGALYVYQKNGSGWINEQKFVPPNLGDYFQFGTAVAISRDGNYLVGGAPNNNEQVGNGGMLYIYRRNSSSWTLVDKAWHADIAQNDNLGESLDMSDDGSYIIAGCKVHEEGGVDAGAAYVFKNDGTDNWLEEDQLLPNDGNFFDRFGNAVGISGEGTYAVVGAKDNDEISSDNGAAYVFKNNSGSWSLEQKLLTSNLDDFGQDFGYSVAINGPGDVILVGDRFDDVNSGFNTSNAGSVYVFSRNGSSWSEAAVMIAEDRSSGDYFGEAVDIADNYAMIGAPNVEGNSADNGAVYLTDNSCWEKDLLAYYPFNGNSNDESANNLHGTANGATLTSDRFGFAQSAYEFDGIDDFIDVPVLNNGSKLPSYTVSAWVNPYSIPQNEDRIYFYYNETSDGKIAMCINSDGLVQAFHHDGSTWRETRSYSVLNVNDWHHIAFVWDGQNLQLYINGTLEDGLAINTLEVSDIGASIGRQDYWYNFNLFNRGLFHGKIDDVKIYGRPLSYYEITLLQLDDVSKCGAIPTSEEVNFMENSNPYLNGSNLSNGDILTFPVAVYYITDDEGNLELSSLSERVRAEFEVANTFFSEAKVQFEIFFEAIFDDLTLVTYDGGKEGRQNYPYYPKMINIIFVDAITGYRGLSNFPDGVDIESVFPDDRIFLRYEVLGNQSTLPHELGHFFGLYHTHHETECAPFPELCEAEKVDECDNPCTSNCGFEGLDPWTTGDRCEDTPVDPRHLPEKDCQLEVFCAGSPFSTSLNNLMSYYDCSENGNGVFTMDQKERIYYYAETAREYIWNNQESPVITILSPGEGNYISSNLGSIHWWYGIDLDTEVDIYYRVNGGEWVLIEAGVPCQTGYNEYSWRYPVLPFDLDYANMEIKIADSFFPNVSALSRPFTVQSYTNNSFWNGDINVGPCCIVNQDCNEIEVTWNSNNVNGTYATIGYSYDAGITWNSVSSLNTGSYTLNLTKQSTEYFILAVIDNNANFDFSDGYSTLNCTSCISEPISLNISPIPPDTYQTTATITSAGTVESGAAVVFQAGTSITLQPGFHAQAGSDFHALIGECVPAAQNLLVQQPEEDPRLLPKGDVTLTVYPNPFRDETVIEYRLTEETEVELYLFSITGAQIRVLQPRQVLPRGVHRLVLSGAELEPGMWFVRMRAGEAVVTQRVVKVWEN